MQSARTSMSLVALLVCGALAAQVPTPPPPAPSMPGNSRIERRTERLNYGSKLWVKNRNGGIRVTGWDREEVSLVAEIRDSERRRIELVLQRRDQGLDIEALFRQPRWNFGFSFMQSPRCEMTLNVPRRLLAHFRTTNGTLSVATLDGFAHCETTNGDIKFRDVSGEVLAETTNGTIEASNLRARIKGGTTNGRVLLEGVDGGIQVETTNGSIRARNLDGWGEGISLETTNGSIEVELGKASGEIQASNSNGSLDVKPAGAQVIEASKHSARVKVPGRSQKITLSTTNGSIRVR